MTYNKAMNISVWITSDGRAHFVKCLKSHSRSRRGSKEAIEVLNGRKHMKDINFTKIGSLIPLLNFHRCSQPRPGLRRKREKLLMKIREQAVMSMKILSRSCHLSQCKALGPDYAFTMTATRVFKSNMPPPYR